MRQLLALSLGHMAYLLVLVAAFVTVFGIPVVLFYLS